MLTKVITIGLLTVVAHSTMGSHLLDLDSLKSGKHPHVTSPAIVASDLRTFDKLLVAPIATHSDPIQVAHPSLDDSTEHYRSKALEYQQEVTRRQALVSNLSELSLLELPVGLVRQGSDLDYTIIISRVRITPAGAYVEAYMVLEIPQTGDKIAFRGTNIRFSHDGGLAGDGRMELIGSYPIKLNDKTLLTLVGNGNTFVDFDCNGFKGMGIEAAVEFSRDLLIPEDERGNQLAAPARVKTSVALYTQSWSDMLVNVSLPPFQVNGLRDVGFSVQNAYLDWSDLANPVGLIFPPGYTSPVVEAGQPTLWQGFYLQRLEVRLPASFARKNNATRVTLGVEHMILDDQGLTGSVFAENVIESGDMSGWSYTLDKLGIELLTNQVKGFELEGKLSIPVLKAKDGSTTRFNYLAQRGADGNYIFAVKIQNEVKLPVFVADVKLFAGSAIIVKERDHTFYPSAMLHGELTINLLNNGPKASFNSIRFENMMISSEAPHFKPGTFGFGREGQSSTVAGFPVVINNIQVKSEGERVGIGFDLTVNVGGSGQEEGFGGTGSLTVWGKEELTPLTNAEGQVIGKQKGDWTFDKTEISGVAIKIKKPNAYELAGTINFFDNDPVYGSGFKGTLTGSLARFGGIQAAALFGRTPAFRYWYADALVKLETGVPLIPGVLQARGFGGGFYSHMKQVTQSPGTRYGETRSGIYYVPDENTSGIKAIMLIGTARPEAMNGDVGLEVIINRHGGINAVTLTGNANFMSLAEMSESKIRELASASVDGKLAVRLASLIRGQVYGSMKLQFDNVNDVFHGNFEIYVNVAGGLLRGVSDGNKAGWAVLHFERSDWYVLIGTPDQPLGLEVAKIFKARSYFMLGQHLPGSPPPPSQVSEILGNINLDYMRDLNELESGAGFAFGLHFLVDTGNLRFLMFYARFAAGTGVDFMLRDYGNQYHCEGSSGPVGINGWYANGQAYAFVSGKIGIRVNLWFYKGTYDILKIGAAAIMQAKGPNPFWMKGTVGGHYSILGGLVKGRCNFEVTVGKDCKPVSDESLLENVNMIADISPAKGSVGVDVFNTPQVAFNIPVGEVFEITDLENRTHAFRAVLNEFVVTHKGESLPGTWQWNSEHDVVIFDGRDILPGEQRLKVRARLTFEEKINGAWSPVAFDGKTVEEVKETEFETAKAPDYLPDNNVLVSYPLQGQVNFYADEYADGFIQLKDGQPQLFQPGEAWIQKIRMTNSLNEQYLETDLQYNVREKKVTFKIPAGFERGNVYQLEILTIPRSSTLLDANVQKIETEIAGTNTEAATLTTKSIAGQRSKTDVRSIFSYRFRASKYNTFAAKMKAMSLATTSRVDLDVNVFQLAAYLRGDELFDVAETGSTGSDGLIQMEALLDDNVWYTKYVYPLVYQDYPLLGWMRLRNRQPQTLGIPPRKDMYFANVQQQPSSGCQYLMSTPPSFTYEYVAYNIGQSVYRDFRDLQQQAVNFVADHPDQLTPRLQSLIIKTAPHIRQGSYRFRLSYIIPGINKVSSTVDWELINRLPDNDN